MTSQSSPNRILIVSWGRRAIPRFTLEFARAVAVAPDIYARISLSRQIANFDAFAPLADLLLPVDTFDSNLGAFHQSWRIPGLRRTLRRWIAEHGFTHILELMPHVWSASVFPAVSGRGTQVRYCVIAHDANDHPGDPTAIVNRRLHRSYDFSDHVITLSEAVTGELLTRRGTPKEKITTLFHPDLAYSQEPARRRLKRDEPIRLLFMGRILPYKGLGLFVDTLEELRSRGRSVKAGVFGEGDLGKDAGRLQALGAEIVNRWLSDDEIAEVLGRHDLLMLSHIEASQSGVAAAASGACLPIVATPVGGLKEQVSDGENGMLAHRIDATALADAVERLLPLYDSIVETMVTRRSRHSMSNFVRASIEAITRNE